MSTVFSPWVKGGLINSARLTIAAVAALLAAKLLKLPESYWAPITAVVVVQSNFGISLADSWQRLAGTALGACCGALLAIICGTSALVYALGIFGVGAVGTLLRFKQPANRFAAITVTIVLLVSHGEAAWVIALHRFLEVSTGILAGLVLSALWPEPDTSAEQSPKRETVK